MTPPRAPAICAPSSTIGFGTPGDRARARRWHLPRPVESSAGPASRVSAPDDYRFGIVPVTIDELTVADEPEPWAAIGFTLSDRTCVIGGVRIHLAGANPEDRGLTGWSLREIGTTELDGLPTATSDREPPDERTTHPNGVTAVDHVVAITPALERTVAGLETAGLDLRRIRDEPTPAGAPRQAFFRLGATILEVVQEPADAIERGGVDRPAFFWGVALIAPELDRTVAGQRRIATPSARQTVGCFRAAIRKVVIGKWLAAGARLFIFDEPTRGIDVGAQVRDFRADRPVGRRGRRRADDFIRAGRIVMSATAPT